jgi:two-component system sensor histidine kinase AtoS
MSTMLGYAPEEMIGKDLLLFVDEEDVGRVMAGIERRRQGIGDSYEVRLIRKDESRIHIALTASPIMSEDGKYVGGLVLLTDLTEREEMERRLQQAEHLAGIGEASAMVGHDLRNPLQGIAGATYLLRNESLTADERSGILDLIEKNVAYSDGIVKDLLDYARPFELTRVEATPREIVANALQAVSVPSRIKVENQSQPQPTVSVDSDRMKRVFVNLIENAVDAIPLEGTITINSKESEGFVEMTISDTGAGLSKEVVENLWKPLQTTKAKGIGMGLAICKRIIDAHGGEISLESKAGQGTAFTIRLPVGRI